MSSNTTHIIHIYYNVILRSIHLNYAHNGNQLLTADKISTVTKIQYNTARVATESNQNEDLNESMRSRRGRPAAKVASKHLKQTNT